MNRITKAERAARIERAQALLLAAGWSIHDSAAGLIVADLMREFGITDRRTAAALESKAARLLRGDAATAQPEIGRPRTVVEFRAGDTADVLRIAAGEVVDYARYSVSAESDGAMRLTSDDADDLIIRVVKES